MSGAAAGAAAEAAKKSSVHFRSVLSRGLNV